ncbi:hypothetical protein KUTeg_005270 [Tegillarca granosa]|uniref:KY-like immunoglobulin-like domain-containing protein n=1 Tax=Tegillarca granosa TaxID=220873 RepID=A0ABQ9FMG6_TEGGR|nr:hypothetical protein KUTeg_005270 [Tegillarca granosa]
MARPDLPRGYLGAQPKFSDLTAVMHFRTLSLAIGKKWLMTHLVYLICLVNRRKAYIKACLNAKFMYILLEKETFDLLLRTQDNFQNGQRQTIETPDNSDISKLIFTHTKGNTISYLLQIPSEGYYKLQVYALLLTDDSKTLQGVFNYLIKCDKAASSVFPYPKQYAQWKEGCYLYEPLILHDSPGNVRFKVYVPKAKAVAVTFNEEWNHLNDTGNDVWEGNAELDKSKGSKVKLNANFSGEEAKYSTC